LPLEPDAALPEPLTAPRDEPLAPFGDPLEPLAPFEAPLAPELLPDEGPALDVPPPQPARTVTTPRVHA
jgi:hypothetical protein